jgi:hypothetical protein
MDIPYPIERAENIQIRYGETVLLPLKGSPQAFVKIFLPKHYGELFTENDIKSVNERTVILALRYRDTCSTSNSYILEIEYYTSLQVSSEIFRCSLH